MTVKKSATVWAALIAMGLAVPAQAYNDPAFDQGKQKMAAGEWDAAATLFGESLGLNSDDPRSFVLRGECFYKMGNYKLAIQDCTSALQYAPNNIRALLIRGICHSNLGKDGMAIVDFINAIKLDPRLSTSFFNRTTGGGVPALQKLESLSGGKVPDTSGTPMSADNADDQDPDTSTGLNVHAIKDYQEAMNRLYPQGQASVSAATTTTTTSVNTNDGDNSATQKTAVVPADKNKKLTPAQADQEANGDNQVGLKKEADTTKTRLSTVFKDSQNNAGLLTDDTIAKSRNERFTPNLDQDPDRGQFGLVPGAGEFQGDAKQAVTDFSQGLKMDPTNAEYFYKRAKAWQKLSKVDNAMGDFNHAILQDPQQAKYYIGRASLYYQLGRTVLMDADVVAARNCNPDLPPVIHFNLAKLPPNTKWAGDGPD